MIFSRVAVGFVLSVAIAGALVDGHSAASAQVDAYPVPAAVDGTGKSDVTTQLQKFFDSVPDGKTIEFPRAARYRVDGTLQLRNRRSLTFEGNGSTVFATTRGARDRAQWAISGGSGFVFRDLTVRGANPHGGVDEAAYREDLAFQHGFTVGAVDGFELDHVTVSDVYGDFVYLGPDKAGTWSQNIWIHDSAFTRKGRKGIAVTAGRNVVIERNHIWNTRRSTFDLEPNNKRGGAQNIHILGNEVGPGRLLFVASHGRGPVDDLVIAGNRLRRVLSVDIMSPAKSRRSRFWVTDNASSTPADVRPMHFTRVDGVVVRNNVQPVRRKGQVGVGLDNVCGAVVTANDFGSGTPSVNGSGDRCRRAVSPNPPGPPAIPGRDQRVSDRKQAPSTSAPTTSTGLRTLTRPAKVSPTDGTGSTNVGVVGAAMAAVAAGGTLLGVTRYRVRARRRS